MNSTTPSTRSSPRYPGITAWGARILLTGLLRPAARGSFRRDALPLVENLRPPLQLLGQENIPQEGPCLLLNNHYYRPGFASWWTSIAISHAVPVEVRWVVTAELTYPRQVRGVVMRPLSRFFMRQVACFYGFFAMPAMPPDPRQSQQRSAVVRQVIEYIRRPGPTAVIGLAPEGRDIGVETLGWPPSGSGRFVQHLARLGLRLVPVGVYEQGGALTVRFGPPFELTDTHGLPPPEVDRRVARQVMEQIAGLLPPTFSAHFQEA